MKRLFGFKYPKTLILILCVALAYKLFSNPSVSEFVSHLGSLGYLGSFIAGLFFTFGFSTPFSVGYFLQFNPNNILLNAAVGGLGAVLSDLFIFSLIRFSFMDEFKRLKKTKPLMHVTNLFNMSFSKKIKMYLLYVFSGLVIASPLPDELGVTMLAGLSRIKPYMLAVLSFIFNTLGILVMLWI